jgi:hypothetical protein
MKPGDTISYVVGDKVYTDVVDSVSYRSGSPAVYRALNGRQRLLRWLTPRRWRRSLLLRPAEPPAVTLNSSSAGKSLSELREMMQGWEEQVRRYTGS